MPSDYKLIDHVCYQVDHNLPAALSITVDFTAGLAKAYLTEVISGIFDDRKNRKYEFQSNTSEVCRLVCEDSREDFAGVAEAMANRLYNSQKEAQQKVDRLKQQVSTGHLFIIRFTQNTHEYILLSKHDPAGVLDLNTLTIVEGLPDEDKSYKGCLMTITRVEDNDTISQVLIRDTSNTKRVAEYWYKTFLETSPIRLDKDNVESCFTAVDKLLAKYKGKYPVDSRHVRNHLISNLKRDDETFDYADDFLDYVQNLDPQHPKFPKKDLIAKLNELPSKSQGGFDLNFKRVPAAVKARKVGDFVPLNEYFDLHIKDRDLSKSHEQSDINGTQEFSETIYSDKIQGFKCVVIKGDKGYEAFRTK